MLAVTSRCIRNIQTLSLELELPRLPLLIQEFIHDQHYSEDPNPPEFDLATAQVFLGKVAVFNSAAASFHAPSDLSGTGGMRCEHIWATPSWRGGEPRHDCIFVNMGADFDSPMGDLAVAQAGVSSKNITLSDPCLEEIINIATKIKTPSLTVYLKPDIAEESLLAKNVEQELTYTSLYPSSTIIEDSVFVESFFAIPDEEIESKLHLQSPWLLRLELDHAKMIDRKLTMAYIAGCREFQD
ncbi:hypothetical protein C8R48DRAFT_771763 [Suillus tomentosus]|nr:hypothetical protein C8R48DRAFT_771763 [Suillus tomentosus]